MHERIKPIHAAVNKKLSECPNQKTDGNRINPSVEPMAFVICFKKFPTGKRPSTPIKGIASLINTRKATA